VIEALQSTGEIEVTIMLSKVMKARHVKIHPKTGPLNQNWCMQAGIIGLQKESLEACISHVNIDDDNRKTSIITVTPQYDTSLNEQNWYAFTGTTGRYRMPTSCVPLNRCNTENPGWLDGDYPTMAEGVVKRKVCFASSSGCCSNSVSVFIRRCYGYFVYKLKSLPAELKARYCANGYDVGKKEEEIQLSWLIILHIL
ncbi:predicted protein, partial [Nematostella vectensis]